MGANLARYLSISRQLDGPMIWKSLSECAECEADLRTRRVNSVQLPANYTALIANTQHGLSSQYGSQTFQLQIPS